MALQTRRILDDTPATNELMAAWRAALVLSAMSVLATRLETRPQALERWRDLLMTFESNAARDSA
jgi:cell division protein FtsL